MLHLVEKHPYYLSTETFVVSYFQCYGNDFTLNHTTQIITGSRQGFPFVFKIIAELRTGFTLRQILVVTVWGHSSDKIGLPLATGQPSISTTPKTLNSIKHL